MNQENHVAISRLLHFSFRTGFVLAVLLLPCTVFSSDTESEHWQLVFHDSFDDASFKERWRLEGSAELQLQSEATNRYLEIQTQKEGKADESVLWCNKQFSGDVRITFRARGQKKNRAILYFNANTSPKSGFHTIFDWHRPDANMSHYAANDALMMYSLGILRDDQEECNLRFLGGPVAKAYRDFIMNKKVADRRKKFGAESIINFHSCPYKGQSETWFDFDLTIEGNQIALLVNGKQIFHTNDTGNVGDDTYSWEPLTKGGWFGFRNFRPTRVDVDDVRVFQKHTAKDIASSP